MLQFRVSCVDRNNLFHVVHTYKMSVAGSLRDVGCLVRAGMDSTHERM